MTVKKCPGCSWRAKTREAFLWPSSAKVRKRIFFAAASEISEMEKKLLVKINAIKQRNNTVKDIKNSVDKRNVSIAKIKIFS